MLTDEQFKLICEKLDKIIDLLGNANQLGVLAIEQARDSIKWSQERVIKLDEKNKLESQAIAKALESLMEPSQQLSDDTNNHNDLR